MVQNFVIIELYFLRILKFYVKKVPGEFALIRNFFKPRFLAFLKNFPKLHFFQPTAAISAMRLKW